MHQHHIKNNFNDYFQNISLICPSQSKNFQSRYYYVNKQLELLNINVKHNSGFNFNFFKKILYAIHPSYKQFDLLNNEITTILELLEVYEASDNNYNNLMIFEDDVLFHKNFIPIMNEVLTELPHDWDIFYPGAVYEYNDVEQFSKNLIKFKSNGPVCTHSWAINNKAMKPLLDDYVKFLENFNEPMGHPIIIDGFLSLLDKQKYNMYAVNPVLTYQGYFGEDSSSLPDWMKKFEGNLSEFKNNDIYVREPNLINLQHYSLEDYLYWVRK